MRVFAKTRTSRHKMSNSVGVSVEQRAPNPISLSGSSGSLRRDGQTKSCLFWGSDCLGLLVLDWASVQHLGVFG